MNTRRINVLPYNLPDIKLFEEGASSGFYTWVPDRDYIVLGQSNKAEQALFADRVLKDQVPVYKRPSGGETVILTPNTLVISFVLKSTHLSNPHEYFKKINTKLIKALEGLGIKHLHQKGISDISIAERKILGSSIYRKKDRIFYHAVLNVSETPERIAYYLKHPSKEPDYRKGRSHAEFVTSIAKEGYELSGLDIEKALILAF